MLQVGPELIRGLDSQIKEEGVLGLWGSVSFFSAFQSLCEKFGYFFGYTLLRNLYTLAFGHTPGTMCVVIASIFQHYLGRTQLHFPTHTVDVNKVTLCELVLVVQCCSATLAIGYCSEWSHLIFTLPLDKIKVLKVKRMGTAQKQDMITCCKDALAGGNLHAGAGGFQLLALKPATQFAAYGISAVRQPTTIYGTQCRCIAAALLKQLVRVLLAVHAHHRACESHVDGAQPWRPLISCRLLSGTFLDRLTAYHRADSHRHI